MRLSTDARFVAVLSLLVAGSAAAQSPVQKVQLLRAEMLASLAWRTLSPDPQGDALRPRLPDAKELAYAIDPKTNRVWFKVSVYDPLPERWFGVNVAVDNDDIPDNGTSWWGTNKIRFDRLASAYLFAAEGYWQGVAGVADSEGAGRMLFTNVDRNVTVALDREQRAIFLGIPRPALGAASSVRAIATVGSMIVNNDDVPNEGAVTVRLTP
ncbi:MAG: hypothetical protein ACRD26_12365 [Vicinamibacterales bacterium]